MSLISPSPIKNLSKKKNKLVNNDSENGIEPIKSSEIKEEDDEIEKIQFSNINKFDDIEKIKSPKRKEEEDIERIKTPKRKEEDNIERIQIERIKTPKRKEKRIIKKKFNPQKKKNHQ